MAAFDQEEFQDIIDNIDPAHQRAEEAPSEPLGGLDIICFILNRTIGSGIIITPALVLQCTGSIVGSLCVWVVGAILHFCGLLIWLELGLSIPFVRAKESDEWKSVPRSGGEKNYLQYIFKKHEFLSVCVFGIPYIVLAVPAGNAIAVGQFVLRVASRDHEDKGFVVAVALAVLTAVVILHLFSRRGGILVNRAFALYKVLLLLSMVVLGCMKASGVLGSPSKAENFNTKISLNKSLDGYQRSVNDYGMALLYVTYSYSGFQQPFYVLSEVRKPRRSFPKYTIIGILIGASLFLMVNVSYFLVVPWDKVLLNPNRPHTFLFFEQLFEKEEAIQGLCAAIALSICGNMVVMSFTASRVKQEIAKEGILGKASLFFATSTTTPLAWVKSRLRSRERHAPDYEQLEHSPMAALLLHWVASVILVLATATHRPPQQAYEVLVSLYSFVIRVIVPIFVSGGLLYLRFRPSKDWMNKSNFVPCKYHPHTILYFASLLFLFITAFIAPSRTNADTKRHYYVIPAIGVSSLAWGVAWYIGFHGWLRMIGWRLVITRTPFVVDYDNGQSVQKAELVEHHLRETSSKKHFTDEESVKVGVARRFKWIEMN